MDYAKLITEARYLATDSGIFTDDIKKYNPNTNYLVDNINKVIQAYAKDLEAGYFDEWEGAAEFLERHGIDFIG